MENIMKTSIKFKGDKLTRTKVCNNIERMFIKAPITTHNNDWYKNEHLFAVTQAERFGVSVMKVSAVIAALSPQTSWDYNKRIAIQFLKTGSCGQTTDNLTKAKLVMCVNTVEDVDRILNGKKQKAFFHNLYMPTQSQRVTIDRHAISIALGRTAKDNELQITHNQYDWFADCYRRLADKLGIRPSMLQSITWEHWRVIK